MARHSRLRGTAVGPLAFEFTLLEASAKSTISAEFGGEHETDCRFVAACRVEFRVPVPEEGRAQALRARRVAKGVRAQAGPAIERGDQHLDTGPRSASRLSAGDPRPADPSGCPALHGGKPLYWTSSRQIVQPAEGRVQALHHVF